MYTKCRGSQCLAGAAQVGYRVPVHMGNLHHDVDIAQLVEQQPDMLWVAGSNPAIESLNAAKR